MILSAMATIQRGSWRQSLPCTLFNQRRLVFKQLRLGNASGHGWKRRCMLGADDKEQRTNLSGESGLKSALETLDSYFEKLQKPPNTDEEVSSMGMDSAATAVEIDQEQPAVSETSKMEMQQEHDKNQAIRDEYALKEELLLTVLKEYEAAETQDLSAAVTASVNKKAAMENQAQSSEGTPLVVLKSNAGHGEEGTSKKEMPLLLLRPGSLLVSTLVGINIGIYIFGLATSQQTNDGMNLAFLQGAKMNELILAGEWWRLLTPTFLHSGPLHLFLSSWAMISFGPQVESLYGSTGLLLIYVLGGGLGNLASFFQTPQATVGGTGPVFAIICSWVVFLVKNRDAVQAYDTLELLQKVVIFSALSVLLGNDLPIDAWTHVGGSLVGILFGAVASPWYQTVDASDLKSRKSDLTLERLALAFLLCSGALLCIYYYCEMQDINAMEDINAEVFSLF